MPDKTDIVVDLRDWAPAGDGHHADERGFCELCSLRMPCDLSVMVADLQKAAAEIVRLRAEVDRYEEIRLRDDAVIRQLQATNLTRYEETSDE